MLKINVKWDIDLMRRKFAGGKKEVNKAAARALTRVAITGRKVADQTIRERVTLKSSTVKQALSVRVPFGERTLVRDIVASGSAISLKEYQARQTKKGATFAVVRGKRTAWVREGRAGFVSKRFGGHVFARVEDDPPGPAKGRIQKAFGPSITQRFRTKKVQAAIYSAVNERWPIEFAREINYRRVKLGA